MWKYGERLANIKDTMKISYGNPYYRTFQKYILNTNIEKV